MCALKFIWLFWLSSGDFLALCFALRSSRRLHSYKLSMKIAIVINLLSSFIIFLRAIPLNVWLKSSSKWSVNISFIRCFKSHFRIFLLLVPGELLVQWMMMGMHEGKFGDAVIGCNNIWGVATFCLLNYAKHSSSNAWTSTRKIKESKNDSDKCPEDILRMCNLRHVINAWVRSVEVESDFSHSISY